MSRKFHKNRFDAGGTAVLLFVILTLRITSYFMISDSAFITQVFKAGIRFSMTAMTASLLLIQSRKPAYRFSFSQPLPVLFYMVYLFTGLSSLLWTSSFNDSALQLTMDAETFVFAFLYIKLWMENYAVTGLRLSKLLSVSIFLIVAAFIIGMIINPDLFYRKTHGGEEARLGGFIINPNELGMLIGVGIGATVTEWKNSKQKFLLVLAVAIFIYAIVLTGSRSSMIAFFLIVFYFIIRTSDLRIRLAAIATLVIAIPFVIKSIIFKQGNVEEVMNMTGRIPFWKDLLTINFPREPLLGYGYMRIDYTDKFESLNAYAGAMTHNTFLQALMGLGLTGLILVLSQLSLTIYSSIKTSHSYKRSIAVALLIPLLINSMTEFGIFGETNYGILFYLMIVFMVCMETDDQLIRKKNFYKKNSAEILL